MANVMDLADTQTSFSSKSRPFCVGGIEMTCILYTTVVDPWKTWECFKRNTTDHLFSMHAKFSEKVTFLTFDTLIYVCVSGGKKCNFFG